MRPFGERVLVKLDDYAHLELRIVTRTALRAAASRTAGR